MNLLWLAGRHTNLCKKFHCTDDVVHRFYKVYLYRLVVILPLYNIINKRKWIDLVCGIISSAIIYSLIFNNILYR